jgi:hypothetical protein
VLSTVYGWHVTTKFKTPEESRIWVSFAGEALNGYVIALETYKCGAETPEDYVKNASMLADDLLVEYQERAGALPLQSRHIRPGAASNK